MSFKLTGNFGFGFDFNEVEIEFFSISVKSKPSNFPPSKLNKKFIISMEFLMKIMENSPKNHQQRIHNQIKEKVERNLLIQISQEENFSLA
jgi:hypothetical protein